MEQRELVKESEFGISISILASIRESILLTGVNLNVYSVAALIALFLGMTPMLLTGPPLS